MGEEVYIVAIVFGSIVTIVTLSIIGSIIKSWVKNRSNKSILQDEDFLEALREFKEKTDRRLSRLESLHSDKKSAEEKKPEKNDTSKMIASEGEEKDTSSAQNLKNMLKE